LRGKQKELTQVNKAKVMDKGVIYEWGTIIVFRECGGFDQLPPKIPAQQKERKKN